MNKQSGQILIIALIFMTVILVFAGILMGFTTLHVLGQRKGLAREQALNLAEAGIEKAIFELNWGAGSSYTGETNFSFGGGVIDITVSSPSPISRIVTAEAFVPDKTNTRAKRKIQTELEIDANVIGFNFGVQVGSQNLVMSNNAQVIGSVYVNSSILGAPGARIVTGNATAASASGNIEDLTVDGTARAHSIDDSTIGGSAYSNTIIDDSTVGGNAFAATFEDGTVGGNLTANTIRRCTVGGNAYFDTNTLCTVGGQQFPGQGGTPPVDPAPQSMPLTDAQIDQWKQDAADGGTINGNFEPGVGATLGPKKINGDLILDGGVILTITGRVWVTGNIDIKNNAAIVLDSSYGSQSEVIISDGWIHIQNNGIFSGSGQPASFLMLLSTDSGSGHHGSAIDLHNNAAGAIFYAHNSVVYLHNNVNAQQLTGQGIIMQNNATITYNLALQNAFFGAGPGAAWAVKRGTRVERR